MTTPDARANPPAHLNAAPSELLEMTRTDLPVPPAEPSDDNDRLPPGARRSYVNTAVAKIEAMESSSDPERARSRWLQELAARAEEAERTAQSAQRTLAVAVTDMERREAAERAAKRAQREIRRLSGQKEDARQRARKNELARADYARRRAAGIERVDGRLGMHACAIAVDPAAYAALKLGARTMRVSIPVMLGRVVHDAPRPEGRQPADAPRWRRTSEGRRANQHTRIAVDDDAWEHLHAEAIAHRVTFARWIGILVERWAATR
jgi:hypothetical protein